MNKTEELFLLDTEELILLQEKHTDENRLLFAVMLKFFQLEGYHPSSEDIIDPLLVSSVSTQLAIFLPDDYEFNWNHRTIKRFRGDIRNFLGFKKASQAHVEKLIAYLVEHAAPKCLTNEQYQEIAYQFFKDQKLEPFSKNKVDRYIATSIARFEHHFFSSICSLLSKETKATIDNLLKGKEVDQDTELENQKKQESKSNNKTTQIHLWQLKKDIAGAKLKLVEDELLKANFLQNISLPIELLASFDRKLLLKYYNRIMALLPSNIKEYNIDGKYSMMAIFIYIRAQLTTDNLVDVLLQLIHKMRTSSESFVNKHIIKNVKCVDGKFDILHSLASINASKPRGVIEKQVYPTVPKQKLEDIVKELDSKKGKWYQTQVQIKINSLYSHGSRSNILKLLSHFNFWGSRGEANDLVDAIEFIKANACLYEDYYSQTDQVPVNAISSTWRDAVITKNTDNKDQFHRLNYEIAILEELGQHLNCKKLWIRGAYRFRSPEDDMPKDFDDRGDYYYGLFKLPKDGEDFTKVLKNDLTSSLKDLNSNILDNPFVKITGERKK